MMKRIALLAAFLLLPGLFAYADELTEINGEASAPVHNFHSSFLAAFEQSLDNNAFAPAFSEKTENILHGLQLAQVSKLDTPVIDRIAVSTDRVTVHWSNPVTAAQMYDIDISGAKDNTSAATATVNAALGTATLTGLEPGSVYQLSVTAQADSMTDSDAYTQQVITAPAISSVATGSLTATLNWEVGSGANRVSNYEARLFFVTSAVFRHEIATETTVAVSAGSVTLSVPQGREYRWTLRATDGSAAADDAAGVITQLAQGLVTIPDNRPTGYYRDGWHFKTVVGDTSLEFQADVRAGGISPDSVVSIAYISTLDITPGFGSEGGIDFFIFANTEYSGEVPVVGSGEGGQVFYRYADSIITGNEEAIPYCPVIMGDRGIFCTLTFRNLLTSTQYRFYIELQFPGQGSTSIGATLEATTGVPQRHAAPPTATASTTDQGRRWTWGANTDPTAPDNYLIHIVGANGEILQEHQLSIDTTELLVTNLPPGTRHGFRNIARGSLLSSDPAMPLLSPPALSTTMLGSRAVALNWEEVNDAAAYQTFLYVADDADNIFEGEIQQADARSSLLDNLVPNTEYVVKLVATAGGFFSGESTIGFTTLEDLSPPILTVSDIGALEATVNWEEVNNAAKYQTFLYAADDADNIFEGLIQPADARSSPLHGLTPNTEYVVKLVAMADHFDSSESKISFTTPEALLPAVLSITGLDSNTVTINWETVVNATEYEVVVTDMDGDSQAGGRFTFSDAFSVVRSSRVAPLQPETEYTATVTANADGFDPVDATTTFTTLQTKLSAPVLTVSDIGAIEATVNWEEVDNALAYQTFYYTVDDADNVVEGRIQKEVDARSSLLGSLQPETAYVVRVVASASGFRPNEAMTTFTTLALLPPIPASALTVTDTTNSVTVSWQASVDTRITMYVLSIDPDPQSEGEVMRDASVAGSYTFTGLDENTPYLLSVRSVGDETMYSSDDTRSTYKVSVATGDKLPTPQLTEFAVDATTVQVDWDLNSAGDATSYIFALRDMDDMVTRATVDASLGTYEITGLEQEMSYTLSITAIAEGLTDSEPIERMFTTPLPKLETPTLQEPVAVAGAISLMFDWNDVSNVQEYLVSVYQGMGVAGERVIGPTTTDQSMFTAADDAMDPRQDYTIEVIARATGFRDSDGATAEARTDTIVLPIPERSAFTITKDTDSITVRFDNEVPASVRTYFTGGRENRNGRFGYFFDRLESTDSAEVLIPGAGMYTYENLQPKTEYTLLIQSTYERGLFDESNILLITISTDSLGQLATPTFMDPVVDQTAVTFRWGAVTADNAVTYSVNVYRGTETTAPNLVLGPMTVTDTSFRVADNRLDPKETYTITVVASAGGYDDSAVGSDSADTEAVQLPNPLADDFQTTATVNSITVTWSNVVPASVRDYFTGDRGTRNGRLGYLFGLDDDNVADGGPVVFVPGAATFTYESLEPATEYKVLIASTYETDFFDNSDFIAITVRTSLPVPTGISVTGGLLSAQASWSAAAAGKATTYQISVVDANSAPVGQTAAVAVTNGSHTLTGLDPNSTYTLRVVAQSPLFGDSTFSTFSFMTSPASQQITALNLHRIGGETEYDSIADYYAPADINSSGLTSIEVDADIADCPDCAALIPLIAMTDENECWGLGTDTRVDTTFIPASFAALPGAADDGVFCDISRGDGNLYLPLGFTAVVWKAVDTNGSVYVGNSNGHDITQLHYIAPVLNLTPRVQSVYRNEITEPGTDGTLNLRMGSYPAEVSVNVFLGDFNAYASGLRTGFNVLGMGHFSVAEVGTDNTTIAATVTVGSSQANQASGLMQVPVGYDLLEAAMLLTSQADFLSGDSRLELGIVGDLTLDSVTPLDENPLQVDFDDMATYRFTFGNVASSLRVRNPLFAPMVTITPDTHTLELTSNAFPDAIDWRFELAGASQAYASTEFSTQAGSAIAVTVRLTEGVDTVPMETSVVFYLRATINPGPNEWVWERYYPGPDPEGSTLPADLNNPMMGVVPAMDNDEDGVPNGYSVVDDDEGVLFAGEASSRMEARFALEEASGNRIRLGRYALLRAQQPGQARHWSARLDEDTRMAFGINAPPGYEGGGIYDFNVDVTTGSATVIIPLFDEGGNPFFIREGQGYQKRIDEIWRPFDTTGDDRLYSSSRTGQGNCPGYSETEAVEDAENNLLDAQGRIAWRVGELGTNTGAFRLDGATDHSCVLLIISDGGRNDADGEENGVVADPGAVGTAGSGTGLGGSGSIGLSMLLFLLLTAIYMLVIRPRARLKGKCSGTLPIPRKLNTHPLED